MQLPCWHGWPWHWLWFLLSVFGLYFLPSLHHRSPCESRGEKSYCRHVWCERRRQDWLLGICSQFETRAPGEVQTQTEDRGWASWPRGTVHFFLLWTLSLFGPSFVLRADGLWFDVLTTDGICCTAFLLACLFEVRLIPISFLFLLAASTSRNMWCRVLVWGCLHCVWWCSCRDVITLLSSFTGLRHISTLIIILWNCT